MIQYLVCLHSLQVLLYLFLYLQLHTQQGNLFQLALLLHVNAVLSRQCKGLLTESLLIWLQRGLATCEIRSELRQ